MSNVEPKTSLRTDAGHYAQDFPQFAAPKIIGHFSLTNDRQYLPDSSRAGYYVHPAIEGAGAGDTGFFGGALVQPMDLTSGEKDTVKKNELLDEGLTHLLTWISKSRAGLKKNSHKDDPRPVPADFVCFRGLFTQLMTTPHEGKLSSGWVITASKFKGTIYLNLRKTEEEVQKIKNRPDDLERFTRWGYKFEQYLFAKRRHGRPDLKEPLVEGEELCCMFRSCLDGMSLLYGAEVDGIYDHNGPIVPQNLIEVKVTGEFKHSGQERTYKRFKLLKYWAQQFTVGIPKILVGFRDDSGTVHRVEALDTRTVHRSAREHWSPSTCVNFLKSFLAWAKEIVTVDDPNVVYMFRWVPSPEGHWAPPPVVTCPTKADDRFLPDWYVKEISAPLTV